MTKFEIPLEALQEEADRLRAAHREDLEAVSLALEALGAEPLELDAAPELEAMAAARETIRELRAGLELANAELEAQRAAYQEETNSAGDLIAELDTAKGELADALVERDAARLELAEERESVAGELGELETARAELKRTRELLEERATEGAELLKRVRELEASDSAAPARPEQERAGTPPGRGGVRRGQGVTLEQVRDAGFELVRDGIPRFRIADLEGKLGSRSSRVGAHAHKLLEAGTFERHGTGPRTRYGVAPRPSDGSPRRAPRGEPDFAKIGVGAERAGNGAPVPGSGRPLKRVGNLRQHGAKRVVQPKH